MESKKKGLWAIAVREVERMASRPLYMLCMLFAPLFCFLFFTTLMAEGQPSTLPVGVVDMDNSAISRSVLRNLDSFQQVGLTCQYADFGEARQALQKGEIYGFFYIPKGFAHDASSQNQPKISVYTNQSYLIPSSLVYRDMKTMAELASGAVGREMLLARGYTMDQAMGFLQPVIIEMSPIGNPTLNYSVYLNNTMLPAVLGLMVLLVTIFSINTELKDGTGKEWMQMADDNVLLAVWGKLLPQTAAFLLVGVIYMVLLYGVYGFPLNSGIFPMALAMLLLVLATQGFGVFLASALPSLRWAMSIGTLWGVLSIPISGFSFPVMGMPAPMQALTNLFPLRHYFLIYVDQALNGIPMHYSAWSYAALMLLVLLPLVNVWRLRKIMYEYVYLP